MRELAQDRAALQAEVLRAALAGRPVPGSDSPARLSDLHLARDPDGAVRVLAEGLADQAQTRLAQPAGGDTPEVRILPDQSQAGPSEAPLEAVVRVRGPQPEGDRVDVSVDVCTVREGQLHPLETTTVGYERQGAEWVVVFGPTTLAT